VLDEKGSLDCLAMGQTTQGVKFLEDTGKEITEIFLILLKGICPNLICHSFYVTFEDEEMKHELKITFETDFLEFKLEFVAKLELDFLLELKT